MASSVRYKRPIRSRWEEDTFRDLREKRYRIPVRAGAADAVPARPVSPQTIVAPAQVETEEESHEQSRAPEAIETAQVRENEPGTSKEVLDSQEWRDRALRLQAEMENYRKRQQRIAEERVRTEQERLLRDVLAVADDLDRTLAAAKEETPIRRGVAATRDELARVLHKYGLERVEALDRSFDPAWHEAVDVVSAGDLGVEPGLVVRVTQAGYRRGERLLRPARVVVAQ